LKNFFVSYKSPLAVTLAIILLGGAFAYSKLQTSLFPEITFPKIKVIAEAGLQPVDKMMVTVTKPLENAIKEVPDLDYVRSSLYGLGRQYRPQPAAHRVEDQRDQE
jgi:multidrug efflux pump subunit AcrB